jgi:hypothetical protein
VRDMSALECVRETLRLGLEALEKELDAGERPDFWAQLWERYVENKFDFRSAAEVLTSKEVYYRVKSQFSILFMPLSRSAE